MDTHLNLVPTYGAVGLPFGLTTGEVEVAWGSPDCVLDEGDGHIDWHYRHARTELCFQDFDGWRLRRMTCFDPESTVAGCNLWDATMESVESALSDRLGESPEVTQIGKRVWMLFENNWPREEDWHLKRTWLELMFECGRLDQVGLRGADDNGDPEWPTRGSIPDERGWADVCLERCPDLEWTLGGLSIERGLESLPFGVTEADVRKALGAPDRVGRSLGDLVHEYWPQRVRFEFGRESDGRLCRVEMRHPGCLVEGRDLWRAEKEEVVSFLAAATSSVPDRYFQNGLNGAISCDAVSTEFEMDRLVEVRVFDRSE